MPTVEVPIGEFLPASPKQNNPGCIVANNCFPAEGGYSPFAEAQTKPTTVERAPFGENAGFGSDTIWSKGTGWTIAAGVAQKTAGSASDLSQTVTLVPGRTYRLIYTLTVSAGTATAQLTGGSTVSGTARTASGTYSDDLVAVTGNTAFAMNGNATFAGTVDNFSIQEVADDFLGPVRGAALFFRRDTTPVIVGGSEDNLFVRAGSLAYETKVAASVVDGEAWDFAQFNDFIFATSLANDPMYLADVDTSTEWATVTGSPPKARFCERFADFLMLGHIDGAPTRIQWSHFNAPLSAWAASRLTQAGFADLDTRAGEVTGLAAGRYPMVFQERGVSLVQYVGPPTVWRVSLVSEDRGCIAPYSIATVGSQTFFLSQDGFWLTNGSEFVPIGSQRVNKWFFETVDNALIGRTQAAVDWANRSVVWSFHSSGAPRANRLLIYSWEHNRFSTATVTTDWLVGSRVDATTLEDLDALFATLEDVTPSMDSSVWLAGDRVLGAFIGANGTSDYATFNGPAMQADWELGAFQPMPGSRVFVSEAQGVIDADDWQVQVAAIAADNARAESFGAYSSPGVNGANPLRADGKEMRLAVRMPANAQWRRAQAVQLTFRASGRR